MSTPDFPSRCVSPKFLSIFLSLRLLSVCIWFLLSSLYITYLISFYLSFRMSHHDISIPFHLVSSIIRLLLIKYYTYSAPYQSCSYIQPYLKRLCIYLSLSLYSSVYLITSPLFLLSRIS